MTDRAGASLGVSITTLNSERSIRRLLESVRPIAQMIAVVDSGSTDRTIEICREFGVEPIHRTFDNHKENKGASNRLAESCAWILMMDSDESIDTDLAHAIRAAVERNDPRYEGFFIVRKLWMQGRWLNHFGYPDRVLRLVRKGTWRMDGGSPHEALVVDGPTADLAGTCLHESYRDLADARARTARYSEISARTMFSQGRSGGGVIDLLVRPAAAFVKHGIIQRGLLDGVLGWQLSLLTARGTWDKHFRLRQLRTTARRAAGSSANA